MNRSLAVWTADVVLGGLVAFAAVWFGFVPVSVALIAGGLAEAVGFGMTFWDLLDTERRVRRFLNSRYGSVHVVVGPATIRATGQAFNPTVTVEPPPPVEHRVERLEQALATVDERIHEAVRGALAEAREAAEREAKHVREDATEADRRLIELISGMTLGGMQVRRLGVFFFVVGLALATAANLVAA